MNIKDMIGYAILWHITDYLKNDTSEALHLIRTLRHELLKNLTIEEQSIVLFCLYPKYYDSIIDVETLSRS